MLSGIAVWVLRLMSTTGLGPAVLGGYRKICVSTLKLPSDVLDLQPPSEVRTNGVSIFRQVKYRFPRENQHTDNQSCLADFWPLSISFLGDYCMSMASLDSTS